MPTVKELKQHLESYKDEDIIAFDIWIPDDAIWQAKSEGYRLTQEQAKEVIEDIHRKKDANIGLNWDMIRCYLPDFDTLPKIPEDCPYQDDSYCYDCDKCKKGV